MIMWALLIIQSIKNGDIESQAAIGLLFETAAKQCLPPCF